jgi:hypothetical protein
MLIAKERLPRRRRRAQALELARMAAEEENP